MTRNQKYYRKRQGQLREQAVEYQFKLFDAEFPDWETLNEQRKYFEYWGKRFGMIREFRENAIL